MHLLIHKSTEFNKRLAHLRRSGGNAARAAETAHAIIGRLYLGFSPEEAGGFTNHGEDRVRNCIKYDLPGAHRLICVRHGSDLSLLYIGSTKNVIAGWTRIVGFGSWRTKKPSV
jgi:hypothetical protein